MKMTPIQFSAIYKYSLQDPDARSEVEQSLLPHLDALGRGKYTPTTENDMFLMESEKPLYVEYDEDDAELKFQIDTPPTERGRDKETILDFLQTLNLSKELLKRFVKTFPDDLQHDVLEVTWGEKRQAPEVIKQSTSEVKSDAYTILGETFKALDVQNDMFSAVAAGDTSRMQRILENTPDFDINAKNLTYKNASVVETTLLEAAVTANQPAAFKLLWDNPNTYKTGAYVNNLMHLAIEHDSIDVFKVLLQKREVDVNGLYKGETPLYHAACGYYNYSTGDIPPRPEFVKLLLQHPDIDPNKGFVSIASNSVITPLYYVQDPEIIALLLQHPDINPNVGRIAENNDRPSPLHRGVYYNKTERVQALLTHPDTIPYLPNEEGETPLGSENRLMMKRSVKKALKKAGCDFRKYSMKKDKATVLGYIKTNIESKHAGSVDYDKALETLLHHPTITAHDVRIIGEINFNDFGALEQPHSKGTGLWTKRERGGYGRSSLILNEPPAQVKAVLEKALRIKIKNEETTQKLQGYLDEAKAK